MSNSTPPHSIFNVSFNQNFYKIVFYILHQTFKSPPKTSEPHGSQKSRELSSLKISLPSFPNIHQHNHESYIYKHISIYFNQWRGVVEHVETPSSLLLITLIAF